MDLMDHLRTLVTRASKPELFQTEEATKMALVVPFVAALGYDVYNPAEVIPEFTADVGIKRGEKVDYAIMSGGQPIILIECKKLGEDLGDAPTSQLYRYFSVTPARVAILTDGLIYRFYSDIEAENKMDDKPFLVVDLRAIDDNTTQELKRFAKSNFDLEALLTAAEDLKYTRAMKLVLSEEFQEPSDEFIRFLSSRVYAGRLGKNIKEKFSSIAQKAFQEFISERIERRLQAALARERRDETVVTPDNGNGAANAPDTPLLPEGVIRIDGDIVTTTEERDGFLVIKAIAREVVDVSRLYMRDSKSYCAILLDDNNRKTVCRLWFNGKNKRYLGLLDEEKNEEKVLISSIDDIYGHAERIRTTIARYIEAAEPADARA